LAFCVVDGSSDNLWFVFQTEGHADDINFPVIDRVLNCLRKFQSCQLWIVIHNKFSRISVRRTSATAFDVGLPPFVPLNTRATKILPNLVVRMRRSAM
jgi:hypothetical protein